MILLFLLSCVHNQDSILQAHSSILVAKSTLVCDKPNKQDCQLTFIASKGTATRIYWDENYYWLTAAHVCSRGETDQIKSANKAVFIDVGESGERETPPVMRFDEAKDLCILPAKKGPVRKMAYNVPRSGENVSSIAYPGGVFYKELKPIYEGKWAGTAEEKCVVTVPVAPGSSGGAILDRTGKIVSVISAVMASFNHFTLTVCLSDIEYFLEQSTPLPKTSDQ